MKTKPCEEEAPRVSGLMSKQQGGCCCEWQNHSAEKDNQEHPVIDIEATHRKASAFWTAPEKPREGGFRGEPSRGVGTRELGGDTLRQAPKGLA